MSPIKRSLCVAALLALAFDTSGCSKKEKKEDAKVTAADKEKKSRPPKVKKVQSKPKVDEELVALGQVVKTEEDFQEAAEKEIVPDNLEAEVDKLDAELTPTNEKRGSAMASTRGDRSIV